jgi:4-phytase/acid phosphatase
MNGYLYVFALLFASVPLAVSAQAAPATLAHADSELRYVVYLSRHGVRSPTGKATTYNIYSSGAWPAWPVQPGYLTPHGFHLMELFGAYDRKQLAGEGLWPASGCGEAANVTVYADSDQRTRETGKAIAQGLMPGCNLPVQGLDEGTNDPIFHALGDVSQKKDRNIAEAAIRGRIGGDPANLTRAYRTQLEALDNIFATCGKPADASAKRTSLFDIPATLAPGSGDHLVDLKGPLYTASTLVENLLLEYTEGMDKASVGWGCVGRPQLESLLTLHTAAVDFTNRTPETARAGARNLLDHISHSIEQAVSGKPIAGALGKPTDRALFLIGHDTNQENVAALLNLTWIVEGRRDDTPPGGSLVFEVWRDRSTGKDSVRTYFTAQTLDQMRDAIPLTATQGAARVSVFVPGCSGSDMSCDLQDFLAVLRH